MREDYVSRQQGLGIDNDGEVEHGYGAERNDGAARCRARQWHVEGWRHDDWSEHGSVGARQSSRGWAGSDVGAEGHGNREVEGEEG